MNVKTRRKNNNNNIQTTSLNLEASLKKKKKLQVLYTVFTEEPATTLKTISLMRKTNLLLMHNVKNLVGSKVNVFFFSYTVRCV